MTAIAVLAHLLSTRRACVGIEDKQPSSKTWRWRMQAQECHARPLATDRQVQGKQGGHSRLNFQHWHWQQISEQSKRENTPPFFILLPLAFQALQHAHLADDNAVVVGHGSAMPPSKLHVGAHLPAPGRPCCSIWDWHGRGMAPIIALVLDSGNATREGACSTGRGGGGTLGGACVDWS